MKKRGVQEAQAVDHKRAGQQRESIHAGKTHVFKVGVYELERILDSSLRFVVDKLDPAYVAAAQSMDNI